VTEILLIGAGLLIISLGLWATVKMAKAVGAANERADQAQRDLEMQKKAGEVLVEHRTADDTVGRLQSGKF
jgi:hypothetical protein